MSERILPKYGRKMADPTKSTPLYRFLRHVLGWPISIQYLKTLTDKQRKDIFQYAQLLLVGETGVQPKWLPAEYVHIRVK